MKVVFLTLEHFRGIETAELHFDGHALLVRCRSGSRLRASQALLDSVENRQLSLPDGRAYASSPVCLNFTRPASER